MSRRRRQSVCLGPASSAGPRQTVCLPHQDTRTLLEPAKHFWLCQHELSPGNSQYLRFFSTKLSIVLDSPFTKSSPVESNNFPDSSLKTKYTAVNLSQPAKPAWCFSKMQTQTVNSQNSCFFHAVPDSPFKTTPACGSLQLYSIRRYSIGKSEERIWSGTSGRGNPNKCVKKK